jgi:hypothetical protein
VPWALRGDDLLTQHLLPNGELQRSRFEEENAFEFVRSDYPGERLIACLNPLLGDRMHTFARACG